jgi:hypothetical protein
MSARATATFETRGWQEEIVAELAGDAKMSRVRTASVYTGDLAGESTIEYLLFYTAAGSCVYIGFEHLTGTLGGRSGSFVLRHDGVFANNTATSRWSVVPDSGSGELSGLRGTGGFAGQHGVDRTTATLDYEFV